MRPSRPLLLSALIASLCGCQGKEPAHLSWSADPQSLVNPFPDARLLGSTGGLTFRSRWYSPFLPRAAQTPAAVQLLDGWADAGTLVAGVGNLGPTLLAVSDPVDPASLPGTVARLAQVGGAWQVLEANVYVEHSTAALAGTGVNPSATYPEFVVVRPAVPLPEGQSGLLVVTQGMKTTAGVPFGRGFEFDGAKGSSDLIKTAAKTLGINSSNVLLVLPQQAEPITPALKSLAQWTATAAAPTYAIPAHGWVAAPEGGTGQVPVGSWKPTDADWNQLAPWLTRWSWAGTAADVGQVVIGTFQSKDLRDATGAWSPALVGAPDGAPAATLYFVLTLPKGTKPAGGYKVVIGSHGFQGRNVPESGSNSSFCLETAEVLAANNLGCLGIDVVTHGTRGSYVNFFNLRWLPATQDNFRQTVFDQMQLSRLSTVLDVDGDGVADLSSELGYFGNSLGSIIGGSFMAVDPRVKYGALNVGGGGLANIQSSPNIRDLLGLILAGQVDVPYQSEAYYGMFPLFRVAGQLFLEQGDPVNVAQGFSASGKPVFLQAGVGDLTVPNFTSDALAASMGLPTLASPASGSTPVQAYFKLDPTKYGQPSTFNGHDIFWYVPEARAQITAFLVSGGTNVPLE